MKKLYLALSFIILACLLSTVLAFLSYSNSNNGSIEQTAFLAEQVDILTIKTTELEANLNSTSTFVEEETNEVEAEPVAKTTEDEPVEKSPAPEAKKEVPEKTAVEVVPSDDNTKAPTTTEKYISASSLNMRSDAKASASVVTVLPKGAKVQTTNVTSKDSGITWVKITYNGTEGWVSQDYLK